MNETHRADYLRVLAETGMTHDRVRAITENTANQVEMPVGFSNLSVGPSEIDGLGVFSDRAIAIGEVIGPARIDGMRTLLGRYVNHSPAPNAEYFLDGENLAAVAIRPIAAHEEVLYDYRIGAALWGAKIDQAEVQKTLAARHATSMTAEAEASIRSRLAALQSEIATLPNQITEWRLEHVFAKGVYIRTLRMQAGDLIVGKIHRHAHFNILQSGTVTVFSKDGLETLTGPHPTVSSAGVKRAVFCHTDAVWTTVHDNPTDETDLAKIEAYVIAPDYESLPYQAQQIEGVPL